jgi:hypothetical protein
MKWFFLTIGRSVYGPKWYREAIDRSLGKAFKYFFGVVVLSTILTVILFILTAMPFFGSIRSSIDAVHQQVIDVFPDALVVNFSEEGLHTNMPDPYPVPMPAEWDVFFQNERHEGSVPKNLVVFDTSKSIERADFDREETLIIVSKTELGIYNPDQGKTEIRSFVGALKQGSIDKTGYSVLVDDVWSWLGRAVPLFALLLIPLFIIAVFVGNVIYMVFGALVVWLGAVLVGKRLAYAQAYKAGLYLLTLPILFTTFFPSVPYLTTGMLFVLAVLNFRILAEVEPQAVAVEPIKDMPIELPEAVITDKV